MNAFALPDNFKIVLNPRPEMPRDVSEWLMYLAGLATGLIVPQIVHWLAGH